jgi:hypothetical protein
MVLSQLKGILPFPSVFVEVIFIDVTIIQQGTSWLNTISIMGGTDFLTLASELGRKE